MDDPQLAQQRLCLLNVPLSLLPTVSRATKLDVGKGGLEGHPEPLSGGEACPPGPLCSLRPAREVVEATAPQLSAGLADREHAREGAQRRTGLPGRPRGWG